MAEKPVKQPKGSKLDVRKRAEYISDVGRVKLWDTSSWPTWTVTGRVLPERCDVTVASTLSQGIGAGSSIPSFSSEAESLGEGCVLA